MSLDLEKIEAAARAAITETTPGNWRHHEGWNGKVFDGDEAIADCDTGADASFIASVSPLVALEMIALIRHQERELTEARERRSEPSAVRVTIVDERAAPSYSDKLIAEMGIPESLRRADGWRMVDHRLRQILNPPAPFHGEKWAAADALYWLTGNQAFADQADGLAAESLKGEGNQVPITGEGSRAYTAEEAREEFIDQVRHNIDYWQIESRAATSREKLEGLAHSMLCIFDGVTGLPAFDLAISPHPDDKQYAIGNGDNWYEPGMVINSDCHLHDLFNEKRQEAAG